MSIVLGDYAVGATVRFAWNSVGLSGASITRSANGTVQVYKNMDSTTESVAGLTDVEDFDTLTGIHTVVITTATDGAFYAAGNDFTVVLKAATIDGQVVNAALAEFSIENRGVNVARLLGTAWLTPGTAGTPDVNAKLISGDTATADNLQTAFQTTLAEAAAVPAANASVWAKINFLFLKARNKITQTATTQTLFADDGATTVATSAVTDNGTIATRNEFA